jgi:ribosomal protein S6
MHKYELLLILPGTLDEREAEQKLNDVVTVVKEFSKHVEPSTLGKNRLAYPVKQIRYGYFYTIIFEAETKQVTALQAKLSFAATFFGLWFRTLTYRYLMPKKQLTAKRR